jgi:hypothetical protein
MGLVSALVTFVVGSLIGGLGIYVGGRLVVGEGDYGHAVWTAVFGALVWTVVGFFFGWLPLLGPALTFLAYLGVIKGRYDAGWIEAAGIALVAWLVLVGVYLVLSPAGLGLFDAVGVPGI